VPYLRQWIQVHPDRTGDAPLFTTVINGEMKAMSGGSINCTLGRLCKRAGIRHVHPHMLRHSRLSELARAGVSDFSLRLLAGWTMDSRMSSRYIHLSGRDGIGAVLAIEGISTEEVKEERSSLLKMSNCPNCDNEVGIDQIFCPNCGMLLDERLQIGRAEEMKALREEVDELRKLLKKTLDIALSRTRTNISSTTVSSTNLQNNR
jgi:integrase/recombinase XerD